MASATPPIRVLGIDPGLNLTGYALLETSDLRLGTGRGLARASGLQPPVSLLEAGVIRLPRSHGDNLPARLEALFKSLSEVIEEFHPQTMCLEEVYGHKDYPETAILMGHARGVICLAARLAGLPVVSFSAKRIKQSVTGNGNASKLQVQRTIQHLFSLDRVPHPPDAADALAAALCYLRAQRARNGRPDGARRVG